MRSKRSEQPRTGGADCLCLCDTNGGADPNFVMTSQGQVHESVLRSASAFTVTNDTGMAVANSSELRASKAGATHRCRATFIGFGERCGNANLSTIIANLQLKYGYECVPSSLMSNLPPTARQIAEIANVTLASANRMWKKATSRTRAACILTA